MNKARYGAYLKTPVWKQFSRLVRERDDGRCVVCNSDVGVEVHHRTYERCPGREKLNDCYCLCKECHKLFSKHGRLTG